MKFHLCHNVPPHHTWLLLYKYSVFIGCCKMEKLRVSLLDVAGLAKIAAKMPQNKCVASGQVAQEGLVYNIPNLTLSSQSGTLNVAGESGINSLPSLILAPNESVGVDVRNAPQIGTILNEQRANQIAEFLNEAVATIRDGMKGMLSNKVASDSDELKSKLENNNKSIREIHNLHNRIIQERQELLQKVAETETEVVEKVAECGRLLNQMEVLQSELRVTNQSLRNVTHQSIVLKVEVEKFRKISQLLQSELSDSRNVEGNLRCENMELKLKLTEKEVETVELKARLQQLQENVIFSEIEKQSGPKKVAQNDCLVGLLNTSDILEKVSKLKPTQSDLKVAEELIQELIREHESCKDILFLVRRDKLEDCPPEIVSHGQSGGKVK